jgi:hypothetical protein
MNQPKQTGSYRMPLMVAFIIVLTSLISFNSSSTGKHHAPNYPEQRIDSVPLRTVIFPFLLLSTTKTSAGVYTADSVLIKTLWSGVTYNAGLHLGRWDGTTDDSLLAPNGNYYIKVMSNTIKAVWEGTIGNNSDSVTGPTIQRGYDRISTMAIAGQYAYYGKNYSEGNPSQLKLHLNTPRQRIQIQKAGEGTGQATRFVATDGQNVYWAGFDYRAVIHYYFIFATKTSNDSEFVFSAGVPYKARVGRTYPSVIDTINNANGVVSGLAVQYNGPCLFASHSRLNQLRVMHKTTGAMLQKHSFTNPGALAVDSAGHLWMTYTLDSSTRTEKFSVDTSGLLTSTGVVLPDLVSPVAIAAAPDNQTIVVADGGSSQQLKAYNIHTGAPLWVFGQAGGYANGPTVRDDKFYWSDARTAHGSFIAFLSNGSFWVGDAGNSRAQHYSPQRTWLNRIAYIPHFYSCFVDANNPARVFADYLEYRIDYSKPIARNNGSWTLVRNWGHNVTTGREDHNNRLRSVTTLSNGRTYAMALDSVRGSTRRWQVLELPDTGNLRYTGVYVPFDNTQVTQLYPDGSLRKMTRLVNVGQRTTFSKRTLTGFNDAFNPVWSADSIVAITPPATSKDPGYFGNPNKVKSGEVSATGVVIVFDGGNAHAGFDNYHLGGIRRGGNKWLWRTAISTVSDYTGPFPPDGAYDIGNNIEYSGVAAMATGRTIFWGYHGEFWKNSQTNKWNIVYDNGLFLNQFGVTGPEVAGREAPYGMAGNAYAANIVRRGDTVYLYHNDEGHHGGIHRWRITGLNTVREQTIPVTFGNTGKGLAVSYYNGAEMNNVRHVRSRVDTSVYINHRNMNLTDTGNFSVSFTGFVQPAYSETYSIYAGATKGVRLWVGGKLLVNQRNAATAAEYSDTIRMTAGLRYPLRLELYYSGSPALASLAWSSASQAKTAIPSSRLTPDLAPDYITGFDLLEKLPYHQVLEHNTYGWTRNPVPEIDSNQYVRWWNVETSIKNHNRLQPDLHIRYVNKTPATATVSRDLGTPLGTLRGWQITGSVNYEGNIPGEDTSDLSPTGRGGSYLEVLDDQGKILLRLFWHMSYGSGIARLYANDRLVMSGASAAMKAIYSTSQPLEINVSGDSASVQYGPFPAVRVPRFDAAAQWNKPKTLRFFAWTNSFNSPRVLDIETLKYTPRWSRPPFGFK